MRNVDNSKRRRRDDRVMSPEQYRGLSDHEKDIEIQKAVSRLQRRIQTILYAFDHGASRAEQP